MNRRETALITALCLATLLVLALGDERIFIFVNHALGNEILDYLFLNVFVPLFFVLPLTSLAGLAFEKYRKSSLFSLLFGAFLYVFSSLLKIVFARPRPYQVIETARIVGEWNDVTFSFPSSTTALAFALALPFFLFHKERVFYFHLFLASSIAFFVVYSGYHWPSDAVAAVWLAFGFLKLFKNLEKFLSAGNFFKLAFFYHRNA